MSRRDPIFDAEQDHPFRLNLSEQFTNYDLHGVRFNSLNVNGFMQRCTKFTLAIPTRIILITSLISFKPVCCYRSSSAKQKIPVVSRVTPQ
jgi:hypothetical protein